MTPLEPDPGEPVERPGTGSTSGSLSEESAVPFRLGVFATGILSLTLGAGFPCLWDSDTLADELRGLPDAFRLVVGRWPRHGPAYYEARVRKLGARETLTLPEFDDLAVAYEFLERRADAIATLARKAATLASTPDREHEYRYHANLGTVYAHLQPGNVDTLRWLVSEADREVPPYVPYSEPILAWLRKHWFLSSCYGLAIVAWLVSLSRRRRQEQRFAMQKRRARGKAPVRDSIPRRSDPPPTR